MKVKYLATLTAASILSLGLVTSCATPEGGETNTNTGEPGVTEVDPGMEAAPDAAPEFEPDATVDPCAGVDSGAEVEPIPSEDPGAGQQKLDKKKTIVRSN